MKDARKQTISEGDEIAILLPGQGRVLKGVVTQLKSVIADHRNQHQPPMLKMVIQPEKEEIPIPLAATAEPLDNVFIVRTAAEIEASKPKELKSDVIQLV